MALPHTKRMSATKPEALEYWLRFSLSWIVPGVEGEGGLERRAGLLIRAGGFKDRGGRADLSRKGACGLEERRQAEGVEGGPPPATP